MAPSQYRRNLLYRLRQNHQHWGLAVGGQAIGFPRSQAIGIVNHPLAGDDRAHRGYDVITLGKRCHVRDGHGNRHLYSSLFGQASASGF
jgi:hypothetical protein